MMVAGLNGWIMGQECMMRRSGDGIHLISFLNNQIKSQLIQIKNHPYRQILKYQTPRSTDQGVIYF